MYRGMNRFHNSSAPVMRNVTAAATTSPKQRGIQVYM
jgi:hypothetical protein